jgi:hypothetical protein
MALSLSLSVHPEDQVRSLAPVMTTTFSLREAFLEISAFTVALALSDRHDDQIVDEALRRCYRFVICCPIDRDASERLIASGRCNRSTSPFTVICISMAAGISGSMRPPDRTRAV